MLYDDKLKVQFSKLVPKKVSEEQFWRSYFYSVEQTKQKYKISGESGEENKCEREKLAKEEGLEVKGSCIKEPNETENYVERGAKGGKAALFSEIKNLREKIEVALNRIDELEERVAELENNSFEKI